MYLYLDSFSNNHIGGDKLLNVRPYILEELGVSVIGHQEIILEAVEHLRNFVSIHTPDQSHCHPTTQPFFLTYLPLTPTALRLEQGESTAFGSATGDRCSEFVQAVGAEPR